MTASTGSSAYVLFGGAGGLGTAVARRLVKAGARVALVSRDRERAATAAEPLGALPLVANPTRFADADDALSRAQEQFGPLAGVACCVGSVRLGPAHLTDEATLRDVLDANLVSAFSCLRAAARALERGGSVVLVSSAAAHVGLGSHEAIAAAKGGVSALVRSAAATYAPRGLRVNAVAPGLVRTPASAAITSRPKALETSTAMHALGRIGEPDDVAGLVDWLLGPDSAWITGQVVGVDGGLATVRAR